MREMIAERIDVDEGAGTEPDLVQCNISNDLHTFLQSERDTCHQRMEFLKELLAEIREDKEEQNLGETEDTPDVRTRIQSQNNVMEVQEDVECTRRGDG